jgi:methionyl-tRNA formyltransferase
MLCKRLDIPYQETPFIGHPDTVKLFREANADLGISLGNPYIPTKVFSVPRFGMINIHGEILPQFQNAQSVIWQIYEGSKMTGYTIHKIDNRIDTGDILLQESFPIPLRDTLEQTVREGVDEILRKAGQGLAVVVNDFHALESGAKPQGKGKSYTTPSFTQFREMVRKFNLIKAGRS